MNLLNDLIYRRNEIVSSLDLEKLRNEEIPYMSRLYYYSHTTIPCAITQVAAAALFTMGQNYCKPLAFFGTAFLILNRTYRYLYTPENQSESLKNFINRLEKDQTDELKEKKIHAAQLIQKILSKIPEKNWPRFLISNTQASKYDPHSNTIQISISDLKKDIDTLEAILAHEVGHYWNKDQLYSEILHISSDCLKFSAACTGNLFLMFSTNLVLNYISGMRKPFREKEADHFSIMNLENGKIKNIRCLWESIETSLQDIKNYNDINLKIFLVAAKSNKGILMSHPTEFQRLTYAMQTDPAKKTNLLKELGNFLSTPFYGDLSLISKSRTYL